MSENSESSSTSISTTVTKLLEGTVKANLGLRIFDTPGWRVIGSVELPYKIQIHLQPPDDGESE